MVISVATGGGWGGKYAGNAATRVIMCENFSESNAICLNSHYSR